jgi:hypothetical protein
MMIAAGAIAARTSQPNRTHREPPKSKRFITMTLAEDAPTGQEGTNRDGN